MAKTYADLKADVAAWMRRGDLTTALPQFVLLTEQEIFRASKYPLRVKEMETEVTLTVTNLTATVPSDCVAARSVKLDNVDERTILYIPPEKFTPYESGFFTIVDGSLRLPLGVTSDIKLVYLAIPAALTNDTDTNDVLSAYYGAFLAGVLKYACAYIKDDNRAALFSAQLDGLLFNASTQNKSMTAGSLVVRTA